MISQDVVLVRYGEIALKDSYTRASWERILAANIACDLKAAGIEARVSRESGRIFLATADPKAADIAGRVFGVVSASPARTVATNMEEISGAAVDMALDLKPSSFAIRPRRSGGALRSEEIGRAVGSAVVDATGARVDLGNPDLEIFVEARENRAYVFTDVVKGVGGLPLGSQGRMLAMVSGGIDSPVAAWMMMKRGCPVSLLHFDARPYADAISQSRRVTEILSRWTSGRKINLITVPISRGVEKISVHYPRATCILCRRLMYRIASEVMRREEALGIVTGYSLGQVASQTPDNIMAEQFGLQAPVYHPLIAMDKTEIIDLARKIGTLDVSEETKPCTAVPRKPMTRAKIDEILAMDEVLGIRDLAKALAEEARVERI